MNKTKLSKSLIIQYSCMLLATLNIFCCIFFSSLFKDDYTYGVPYDQSSDLYTIELFSGKNDVQQVFQPQYEKLNTVAVRIENDEPEQMTGNLLFEILYDDTVIWDSLIKAEDITDWRYVYLDVSEIEFNKNTMYTLKITCPSGQKTYPYRIFLSQDSLRENRKLSYNNEVATGELDMTFTYSHFNEGQITAMIILYVVIIMSARVYNHTKKYLKYIVVVGNAFALVFMIEYLCNNHLFLMSIAAIIFNMLIILLVYLLFLAITSRYSLSLILTDAIFFVCALVNHFVLQFRGTVILPSDIYSIQTAANVAENYQVEADAILLIGFSILLTLISISISLIGQFNNTTNRKNSVLSFGIIFTIISVLIFSPASQEILSLSLDQSAQTSKSHEIGFVLNFMENIPPTIYKKPSGYSVNAAENIFPQIDQVNDSEVIKTELPSRIIVVMNESFTDLGYLNTIDTDHEYLSNFNKIAASSNSKTGKCVVPVFGGGTSCSEFELLTGCSMLFFGAGNAPYQQYIHSETASVASLLSDLDYTTLSLHPANPKSWNRDIAYPLLGFDRFISSNSIEFSNPTTCRYWADDAALFNELYEQSLITNENLFEFGLTIQCHGGYEYSGDDFETTVHIENYDDPDGSISQYLTLVQLSDKAFGKFIEDLEDSNEKTIFLMFGDHLPGLSSDFYKDLLNTPDIDGYPWCTELFETPYLFWSNYDVSFDEIPDVLSANFLSTYLLKCAGVPLSPYYQFLYNLSRQYPVVSKNAILDNDGNDYQYEKNSPCYEALHDYEMLQYYILHQ